MDVTGSLLDLVQELGDYDGRATLRVGVMENARNIDTGEPVAPYAAANEFGTSRIPARPFLRSTIDAKGNEWADYLGKAIRARVPLKTALELTGEKMKSDVKATIAGNMAPANAPSTIRRKLRQEDEGGGMMHSGTLIETGSLLRSIDYEVTP